MPTLDELKEEATSLGVTFNKRIGAVKLQEKINTFYESQETSGPALAAVVKKEEAKEAKKKETKEYTRAELAQKKRFCS